MRTRTIAVLSVCVAALGASLLHLHGAGAAPPRPIAVVREPFYADREAVASAEVKTRLTVMRREIASSGREYTIGYTSVFDRPIEAITGLKVPATVATEAASQFVAQKTLLSRDVDRLQTWTREHPRLVRPAADTVADFTASSARGDWRPLGVVGPVRDQGYCGSCWAFAVMGAYEASYIMRNHRALDSSEQVLVSCSTAGSCGGGWTGLALAWLQTKGSAAESVFPYVAQNAPCKPYSADLLESAWGYVRPDGVVATTAELKQAIVEHGPVIVALYATNHFKAYASGVYFEPIPVGALNHAVVLVGWDDAKQAWILRNSWGTGWGETAGYGAERGYMYLRYGSSDVGIWSQWVKAQKELL